MRSLLDPQWENVYQLAVVPGMDAPRRQYQACLSDDYEGTRLRVLGTASNLDAALWLIFSHLTKHSRHFTRFTNGRYKLDFHKDGDSSGTRIVVDFGDPFAYGIIHVLSD